MMKHTSIMHLIIFHFICPSSLTMSSNPAHDDLYTIDTPLCDKVCQWLAPGWWFFQGTLESWTLLNDLTSNQPILYNLKSLDIPSWADILFSSSPPVCVPVSYISKDNSWKLCMLVYYHMKICISLQLFDPHDITEILLKVSLHTITQQFGEIIIGGVIALYA